MPTLSDLPEELKISIANIVAHQHAVPSDVNLTSFERRVARDATILLQTNRKVTGHGISALLCVDKAWHRICSPLRFHTIRFSKVSEPVYFDYIAAKYCHYFRTFVLDRSSALLGHEWTQLRQILSFRALMPDLKSLEITASGSAMLRPYYDDDYDDETGTGISWGMPVFEQVAFALTSLKIWMMPSLSSFLSHFARLKTLHVTFDKDLEFDADLCEAVNGMARLECLAFTLSAGRLLVSEEDDMYDSSMPSLSRLELSVPILADQTWRLIALLPDLEDLCLTETAKETPGVVAELPDTMESLRLLTMSCTGLTAFQTLTRLQNSPLEFVRWRGRGAASTTPPMTLALVFAKLNGTLMEVTWDTKAFSARQRNQVSSAFMDMQHNLEDAFEVRHQHAGPWGTAGRATLAIDAPFVVQENELRMAAIRDVLSWVEREAAIRQAANDTQGLEAIC